MKKLITLLLILALLLPAAALAEDEPDPICGRWTFYWDTRPMNDEYNNGQPIMSFIVLDYSLFIFEDNSLYFVMSSIPKNRSFKTEWPAYNGLWMKRDDGSYLLRLTDGSHAARFDDQGRLLVSMNTSGVPYPFIRIPSYDYIKETSE